ncbi:esterase EstP [Pseudomonas sp. 5P_3.1_Bac2]|uniref:esterase EstP n=1 Tax=Pseudomonas sp. 5P_3.1_Bac2 TaxID=2971617 RepID=UPI0021C9DC29|nr:esterase EstP [Pseudomonas sp. 5P_3.1_Bac2]MCU1717888.1 autotransporter domain-containing protein [Pseudomonas sp. 5P_3.1_Bac2]
MKHLLTPIAAACLLAAPFTDVSAGPYSGMVVFGDSLSDAGQYADAAGPDGATRRFTNRVGPTYQPGSGEIYGATSVMLLNQQLGLGQQTGSTSPVNAANGVADGNNWAVGGYRTDQIYDSIATAGGSVVGTRTRDGYLVGLANSGQRLDSNTLFYVNGGGNDFLQGTIFSLGAEASAGQLADGVAALQGAGARYIMVSLLPNVGTTPAISGTPLAATVSQIGEDFNVELIRRLEGIDAQIIPLNVPLMFDEMLSNAAAQGFDTSQNLMGTCFDGCAQVNSTWGINSATPDPSKLIYNDSVHPTTQVQQIFADYAYSLLAAPWELSLLPEMAHGSLRNHQDQLRNQLLADWQAWQAVGQWRSFVSAGGQRLDFDSQRAGASGDGNGYNLNLGSSYRLNQDWRIGLAAGLSQQDLEAGRADSDYKLRSYLLSAFAQYQHERWWADLAASAGYLDYDDLKRKFDLGKVKGSEKGDSDGKLWAFSGRLGYDIAQHADSAWHLSPFISADYAKVEVDGYSESGARSTALSFADQQRTSKRLGVGLQGRWQVAPSTLLFAEVAQEKEYEDDQSHVRASLNSLPSVSFKLDGYEPDDRLQRLSLGFSQQLAQDLSLRGAYNLRKGSDDQQQGVSLALSLDW